ncbi:CHRD domain-containing protein [Dyadobacter subterraneus]|uniref:CHRD domain-containing protein n=1 Tax=Dyadobacter subterraneus TaxID=2773304 RepID=A0ABR9WD01_9BACT|nr:CHRD domain-containing protein [Dyadobacter subterraneus]MBE9462246.1 CHRD domain-containing protein [Dyadobacter subterraneus]
MRILCKLFPVFGLLALLSSCVDHNIENQISQTSLTISPAQEITFNSSPAYGAADVSYNKNTHILSFNISWNNLTDVPTGAHIHGTGPRGLNAPIIFDFANAITKTTSGNYSQSVLVDGTTLKEEDLLNGLYYFNFHTSNNPSGEMRGQIEFYDQSNVVSKKGIVLSGANEVPVNASTATGTVDYSYNKTTKLFSFFLTWNNLSEIITGSHIHGIAPKGTNATVIFDFFPKIQKAKSGSFSNSFLVDGTAINETDLLAGKYYFNIHSAALPAGEIRAQIEF